MFVDVVVELIFCCCPVHDVSSVGFFGLVQSVPNFVQGVQGWCGGRFFFWFLIIVGSLAFAGAPVSVKQR